MQTKHYTQEELQDIKDNHYLDSSCTKYLIDYIDEKYPKYFEKMDLANLDENKEYPIIWIANVVFLEEFSELEENMPKEFQNRSGNEKIYLTTLKMYRDRANAAAVEYVNEQLKDKY